MRIKLTQDHFSVTFIALLVLCAVLSSPACAYLPIEPYISNIEPQSGPVGTSVTLSGMNFGMGEFAIENSSLYFSGRKVEQSEITYWSNDKITFNVPTINTILLFPSEPMETEIYVIVNDVKSNSVWFLLTAEDNIPPEIEHDPIIRNAKLGESIPIEAIVTDHIKVGSVLLHYRDVNGFLYTIPMSNLLDGKYMAEIPGQEREGAVRYMIEARDFSGNITRTDYYAVRIIAYGFFTPASHKVMPNIVPVIE